jgi:cytidine deaminase
MTAKDDKRTSSQAHSAKNENVKSGNQTSSSSAGESENKSSQSGPEIFIGLVGPIGTDHDEVFRTLHYELSTVNYNAAQIKVSRLIHDFPGYEELKNIRKEDIRYTEYIKAGTEIRELFQTGSALAQQAIFAIRNERMLAHRSSDELSSTIPVRRKAYVINSLKNPEEARFFRETYGANFYLLAINTPREHRVSALSAKISESYFESDPQAKRSDAERLINIDELEDGTKLGQNVRGTFPDADFFVNARTNKTLRDGIERFVRLVFRDPFESPNVDELSMFYAKAASMRSADLSRQVGAVIVGEDGSIIATGCNDVPKAHGGIYWGGDENDYRDFQLGRDSNAKYKDSTLAEILGRLKQSDLLQGDGEKDVLQNIIDEIRHNGSSGIFEGSRVTNVIEFGRMIHAEMAAITHAARFGLAVRGTSLYCTTFPCHMCARHIIASGIKKVMYIEPYPKSLARELYTDSLAVDPESESLDQVAFLPYSGAAPRRFPEFFEKSKRKDSIGRAIHWDRSAAFPRNDRHIPVHIEIESHIIVAYKKKFDEISSRRMPETAPETGHKLEDVTDAPNRRMDDKPSPARAEPNRASAGGTAEDVPRRP